MFRCLFLMALLTGWSAAQAQPVHSSAGLIAHACVANEARYLLAFDPVRGRQAWGHLGGRAEGDETPFETATREFREESNCVYALQSLRQAPPGPASCTARFCSFALQVPFKSAAEIEAGRACADVEREQWVWVRHADLMRALQDESAPAPRVPTVDGPQHEVPLWVRSAQALRHALAEGVMTRQDPCAK